MKLTIPQLKKLVVEMAKSTELGPEFDEPAGKIDPSDVGPGPSDFGEFFRQNKADPELVRFASTCDNAADFWHEVPRPDWLLWLVAKLGMAQEAKDGVNNLAHTTFDYANEAALGPNGEWEDHPDLNHADEYRWLLNSMYSGKDVTATMEDLDRRSKDSETDQLLQAMMFAVEDTFNGDLVQAVMAAKLAMDFVPQDEWVILVEAVKEDVPVANLADSFDAAW